MQKWASPKRRPWNGGTAPCHPRGRDLRVSSPSPALAWSEHTRKLRLPALGHAQPRISTASGWWCTSGMASANIRAKSCSRRSSWSCSVSTGAGGSRRTGSFLETSLGRPCICAGFAYCLSPVIPGPPGAADQARRDAYPTQVEVARNLRRPQSFVSKCESAGWMWLNFTNLPACMASRLTSSSRAEPWRPASSYGRARQAGYNPK